MSVRLVLQSISCPCEGEAVKTLYGENCAELFGIQEVESFRSNPLLSLVKTGANESPGECRPSAI